jgi:hypothetical protein
MPRSALLTQDRVLHNLAISRGFRSFVHTSESGLTDRRLAHVFAVDKYLPVYASRTGPSARSADRLKAVRAVPSPAVSARRRVMFMTISCDFQVPRTNSSGRRSRCAPPFPGKSSEGKPLCLDLSQSVPVPTCISWSAITCRICVDANWTEGPSIFGDMFSKGVKRRQ